jgi:hypothetical protein
MSKKGKHKSLDKSLKPVIAWLESLDIVERIILGISEACRHTYSPGHLKYQGDTEAGIRLNAYSGKGVTKIFVRVETEDKDKLIELIEKRME